MKNMDRPLIAIVAAIVILLIVAVVVVLSEPPPEYMPEGEPEGVGYNYLLALILGDFERAYGYLSPEIPGYPDTLDEFIRIVRRYPWQFGLDGDVSFSVEEVYTLGSFTYVTIQETWFTSGDVLSPSYHTSSFDIELTEEQGVWLIRNAERYFAYCWSHENGCN